MAIVGQPGSEWRSIVEGELGLALSKLELLLKGIDLLPVLEHFLFLVREAWSLGDYIKV